MIKRASSILFLALLLQQPPVVAIGLNDIFRGIEGEVRERINDAIRDNTQPSRKSPEKQPTPAPASKPEAGQPPSQTGEYTYESLERLSSYMNETWGQKFVLISNGGTYEPVSPKTKVSGRRMTANHLAAILEGNGFKPSENELS